jgi:hypothetical protein
VPCLCLARGGIWVLVLQLQAKPRGVVGDVVPLPLWPCRVRHLNRLAHVFPTLHSARLLAGDTTVIIATALPRCVLSSARNTSPPLARGRLL